ncbi:MAG: hypothetical protein LBH25_04930 [Fibromonadaceae bacterium]|jgi:lysylphosphatidylglycerol synthetase-like protein (DUF2156 family)|nr:hypothetical protein [Fibromonadaceae bacterium]
MDTKEKDFTKNSVPFRLLAAFFFIALIACILLLLGAMIFFNSPGAGIWLADLLR